MSNLCQRAFLYEFAPIIEHGLLCFVLCRLPLLKYMRRFKNTFYRIWSELHCSLYFSGVIRQNKSNISLQYEAINEPFVLVCISRAKIWYMKYEISCVKTSSSAIEPWIRTNHIRYIICEVYEIWTLLIPSESFVVFQCF